MSFPRKIGLAFLLLAVVAIFACGLWLRSHWYLAHVEWATLRKQPDEAMNWCTRGLEASPSPKEECTLRFVRSFLYFGKQDIGAATNDLNRAIYLAHLSSARPMEIAYLYTVRDGTHGYRVR